MGGNQDARPFVDLQKDAEEFRQKFDGDIKKCMAFLDGKITALIREPESLASPSRKSAVPQNSLVEFSKAKYEIFVNVKTVVNEMEREWIKYISEMKKLFIENVEIFLAGTKLEVKLPPSEFQTSPGFKKSPRKEKSSITDSLYPIINSFAKNMAVLGSPLRNKEAITGRKSTKEIFDDSCLSKDKEITDDESDVEEEPVKRTQSDQLKQGNARVLLLKDTAAMFGEKACARNEKESDSTASDSESGLNTSRPTPRSRGRQSSEGRLSNSVPKAKSPAVTLKLSDNSDKERDVSPPGFKTRGGRSRNETKSSSSQEHDVSPPSSKSRGRQSKKETKSSSSQESEVSPEVFESRVDRTRNEAKSDPSQAISTRKSRGRSSPKPVENKKQTRTTAKKTESKENENVNEMETTLSARKSRGRSIQKPNANIKQTRTAPESTESEENEEIIEKETSTRSRQRNKTPAKQTKSAAQKSSTTTEESESESSTKSRQRGKTPAKLNKSAAEKPSTTTEESESESTKEAPRSVTKGRKGRTPAKNKLNSTIDNDLRMTRRGAVFETPVAPPSPKKSNLANSHIESERSKSPKKVSFIPSYEASDLDAFTPSVKSKSSIRRKTLLPNLDDIASGADIIPGASYGRANKRKTIGGISDIASATPPKRLKVGESRKSLSSNPVDDDTDNNLLENDGDYSDWIPLRRIDGKIPTKPGIYEVKVGRAKKPAYIGHCESLRQKMTLHKLGQNSGHKHLDKFIERNMDDIQIRYEVMSSSDKAKSEVKDRIKMFVSQYKTTPAYN